MIPSIDLSRYSTGQLFTQLAKNALRRTSLVDSIINSELSAEMKVAMIKCTRNAEELQATERIAGELGVWDQDSQINQLIDHFNWEAVTKGIDVKPKVSAKKPSTKESCVYFIESKTTGLVKIGRSINPKARFASIRTMSPDELVLLGYIPETSVSESDLHRQFSHLRQHGEWFEFGEELHELIGNLNLKT